MYLTPDRDWPGATACPAIGLPLTAGGRYSMSSAWDIGLWDRQIERSPIQSLQAIIGPIAIGSRCSKQMCTGSIRIEWLVTKCILKSYCCDIYPPLNMTLNKTNCWLYFACQSDGLFLPKWAKVWLYKVIILAGKGQFVIIYSALLSDIGSLH